MCRAIKSPSITHNSMDFRLHSVADVALLRKKEKRCKSRLDNFFLSIMDLSFYCPDFVFLPLPKTLVLFCSVCARFQLKIYCFEDTHMLAANAWRECWKMHCTVAHLSYELNKIFCWTNANEASESKIRWKKTYLCGECWRNERMWQPVWTNKVVSIYIKCFIGCRVRAQFLSCRCAHASDRSGPITFAFSFYSCSVLRWWMIQKVLCN